MNIKLVNAHFRNNCSLQLITTSILEMLQDQVTLRVLDSAS